MTNRMRRIHHFLGGALLLLAGLLAPIRAVGGDLPAVVATDPVDNAVGVPVDNVRIAATFDQPMSSASIDNQTFLCFRDADNTAVAPESVSFDNATYTATFAPAGSLEAGTRYRVVLVGEPTGSPPYIAIRSRWGVFLPDNVVFFFTTRGTHDNLALLQGSVSGCSVVRGNGDGAGTGALLMLLLPLGGLFLRKVWRGRRSPAGRTLLLPFLCAASLSPWGGTADAFGPVGPLSTVAGGDNVVMEAGYFHAAQEWEPAHAVTAAGPVSVAFAAPTVHRNQLYLQGALGVTDNVEGFFRIGGADLRLPQGFDASYGLFGAVGMRGTLYRRGPFRAGPFATASIHADRTERVRFESGGIAWSGTVRVRHPWDLEAGILFQRTLGGAELYGGPLLSRSGASVRHTLTSAGNDVDVSGRYRSSSPLGLVLGLRMPLFEEIVLSAETRLQGEFSAGAALSVAY